MLWFSWKRRGVGVCMDPKGDCVNVDSWLGGELCTNTSKRMERSAWHRADIASLPWLNDWLKESSQISHPWHSWHVGLDNSLLGEICVSSIRSLWTLDVSSLQELWPLNVTRCGQMPRWWGGLHKILLSWSLSLNEKLMIKIMKFVDRVIGL